MISDMKTATMLKKRLSKKQMMIIGAVAAVPVIAAIVYGIYILLQQTAISTRANEEAPSNVIIQPSGTNQVQVSWETGTETSAVIEYGSSPDANSLTKVAISEATSRNHSVDISQLEPGTYYFQIRIGENVYDNGGVYWSFTVPGEEETSNEATSEATISPSVSTTVVPTPTPSKSPIQPADTEASSSATITPQPLTTPTPGINPAVSICTSTNCSQIQSNLGSLCTTQDYLKCIFSNSTATPTPSTQTASPSPTGNNAPTPTNASSTTYVNYYTKQLCKPTFLQANSCNSWSWSAMGDIDKACADTFTKYFVQCKSSSFSNPNSGTWYCNKTVTGSELTLPCDAAPTPAAGQSVFCRVRAETAEGGAKNATDWVEMNSTCPAYTGGNIDACEIQYLQSNNCRSWIWDLKNNKDTQCQAAFSKYFFQCTSNGNFAHLTTTPTPAWWYCNTTTEEHFFDFPCYNAPTPADGAQITCRVRAEDSYGGDGHSTAWTTTSVTCPTSTPTPSITATPTHTPTPTPTFTPTPTP